MDLERKVEKLPQIVKTNGFTYNLLKRTDKVLMYKNQHGYEVFKNKIVERMSKEKSESLNRVYKPSIFTHTEKYPTHEDFGKRALYTPDEQRADEIFEIFEFEIKSAHT